MLYIILHTKFCSSVENMKIIFEILFYTSFCKMYVFCINLTFQYNFLYQFSRDYNLHKKIKRKKFIYKKNSSTYANVYKNLGNFVPEICP